MVITIRLYGFILLVLLFFSVSEIDNKNITIQYKPTFNNQELVLENTKYCTINQDTITVTNFKFYISNLSSEFENGTIFKDPEKVHLIDFKLDESMLLKLNKIPNLKIKKVTFNIGIDSLTNVTSNLEADLDPRLGMYWAWNSGYINMKLEGKSNSCTTLKKDFQFHIGGYLPKQNALQTIQLSVKENSDKIGIKVDINKWIGNIKLKETSGLMVPGGKAILMSNWYKNMFSSDEKE